MCICPLKGLFNFLCCHLAQRLPVQGPVVTGNICDHGVPGYDRIPATGRITRIEFRILPGRKKGDISRKCTGFIQADCPDLGSYQFLLLFRQGGDPTPLSISYTFVIRCRKRRSAGAFQQQQNLGKLPVHFLQRAGKADFLDFFSASYSKKSKEESPF